LIGFLAIEIIFKVRDSLYLAETVAIRKRWWVAHSDFIQASETTASREKK
jgi:hypothetical protein